MPRPTTNPHLHPRSWHSALIRLSSFSVIFLILLETDFMKRHSAFWAVVHEDGFQRGYLHVLIDLGNLDAATPGVEIAGDILLAYPDRNAIEKSVEQVSKRLLGRVNIHTKPLDEDFFVTVFASMPVTGNETPELAAQYVIESWHSESHNEPRCKYSIKTAPVNRIGKNILYLCFGQSAIPSTGKNKHTR